MTVINRMAMIANNLKSNNKGRKLYDLLESCGFRACINRFYLYYLQVLRGGHIGKSPEESKKYFEDNTERLNKIYGYLADKKSVDTLKGMIRFRSTGDYKDLPENHFHTQYFINDFFSYKEKECFIDCGAFDGDSSYAFKKLMKKNKIKDFTIVGFEPDKNNQILLKNNVPDICIIPAGVWNENTELKFFAGNASGSSFIGNDFDKLKEDEIEIVPVKKIDDCAECKNASFIKMDVEGSEYNALLGAKETIIRNKPKLAICIYHSNEDMIRLIELVHAFVPEYKIFVRQHSNTISETVMYATI